MRADQLIPRAMKTIGALAAGEAASGEETDDALTILNAMVDGWGAQRLTIHIVTRTAYNLTANTQTYTIGTGGTFNQARPVWIPLAGVIPDSTKPATELLELPIELLDVQEWWQIPIKGTKATYPLKAYYDREWSAGLGNISVWPIPNVANVQLVLYTPRALVKFADLTTDYTFPPGYEEALKYQLAKRLAPEFGRPWSAELEDLARETFAVIKRANEVLYEAHLDAALISTRRGYNWRSDTYR